MDPAGPEWQDGRWWPWALHVVATRIAAGSVTILIIIALLIAVRPLLLRQDIQMLCGCGSTTAIVAEAAQA
jgi:hypothetical protein